MMKSHQQLPPCYMLLQQPYLVRYLAASSWYSLVQARGAATTTKKGGKDKGPRRTGDLSKTHATGCALVKGENDPELRPDHEYPDWLWQLAQTAPTAKELIAKYQGQGLDVDMLRRLWRLKNKERIKEQNTLRAK